MYGEYSEIKSANEKLHGYVYGRFEEHKNPKKK